jgi:inosine-uridine nucleoside N-ribohydrolase
MSMMIPRKILIDTDPGIDDAMAIFYALASPELDVLGLTTIFGNGTTEQCTQNALTLLEIAARTDIPVAKGTLRPLAMPFMGAADFVHGADAMGDIHLPAPALQPVRLQAALFIIETVMRYPGEVTLVPLAALTNIALALHLAPDLPRYVRDVVLMGGNAFAAGNASPAAEANILHDPEAADVVFSADWDITMIGLDVTEKAILSSDQMGKIGTWQNPRAQHIARILPRYRRFHQERYNEDFIHVHDSTTITYLLAPQLFKTVQHPICVELHGMGRGKTYPGLGRSNVEDAWSKRRKVNIALDMDVDAAIAMEMERLAR